MLCFPGSYKHSTPPELYLDTAESIRHLCVITDYDEFHICFAHYYQPLCSQCTGALAHQRSQNRATRPRLKSVQMPTARPQPSFVAPQSYFSRENLTKPNRFSAE